MYKILPMIVSICLLYGASFSSPSTLLTVTTAEKTNVAQPDYQKWGNMAVLLTKQAYPDSEVTDYEYLGRKEPTATVVEDSFELKLKENGKEKEIIVYVTSRKDTEELISVRYEEKGSNR